MRLDPRIFISVFCGGLFALGLGSIMPELGLTLILTAGAVFTLLLCIALTFIMKSESLKYARIESELGISYFYRTNGNFKLADGVRNGNIYFCDGCIICVSVDKKPYCREMIPSEEIGSFGFSDSQLTVFMKDGRIYSVTVPDAGGVRRIEELLREKNWI